MKCLFLVSWSSAEAVFRMLWGCLHSDNARCYPFLGKEELYSSAYGTQSEIIGIQVLPAYPSQFCCIIHGLGDSRLHVTKEEEIGGEDVDAAIWVCVGQGE